MQSIAIHNSQGIRRRVVERPLPQRSSYTASSSTPSRKKSQTRVRLNQNSLATILGAYKKVSISHSVYSFFFLSLALYLYMVVSIVHTTVERKAYEDLVREKTTNLSYKETQYSERVGNVSLLEAQKLGFVESTSNTFTENNTPVFTLNQ